MPNPALVFRRGILRGMRTLLREREWGSSLGALFGVFLLLQLLVVTLFGLHGVQSLLRERTDLRLEIKETASDTDIQRFFTAVQNLPYVRETVYITREQAYERTRETDAELIAFLEEFNVANPFSDTIGLTLASLDQYEEFADFVEQEQWHAVVDPIFLSAITDQERSIHELLRVTRAGSSLTLLILAITATALVFITTELTRRSVQTRSDEVMVERLVGASPISILLPFLTEAVILFSAAILLSSACVLALLAILPAIVPAIGSGGVLAPLRAEVIPLLKGTLPLVLALELLLSPVIAGVGTWMGIRPQVRTPRIALA